MTVSGVQSEYRSAMTVSRVQSKYIDFYMEILLIEKSEICCCLRLKMTIQNKRDVKQL